MVSNSPGHFLSYEITAYSRILHRDLMLIQQGYYDHIRSRKRGTTWEVKFCDRLITTTHLLCNKRNFIEHDRSSHGLNEIENVRLEKEVKLHFCLGMTGLLATAVYLFRSSILDL